MNFSQNIDFGCCFGGGGGGRGGRGEVSCFLKKWVNPIEGVLYSLYICPIKRTMNTSLCQYQKIMLGTSMHVISIYNAWDICACNLYISVHRYIELIFNNNINC